MRRLRLGVSVLAALLLAGGWLIGDDKADKKDDTKKEAKKPETEPPLKFKGQLPANYKKLGLSDDQKQQIYKIQATYKDKLDAIEKQKKDLTKAKNAEYKKILTKAQIDRLKELTTASD